MMPEFWRLIDSGPSGAFLNMSLDEAISVSVRAGRAPTTIRLYGWEGPAVSIGAFQDSGEIDLDYCELNAIPVVRRPTGGRAIFHGEELTYSLSARTEGVFSKSLRESYRAVGCALRSALEKTGIRASVEASRKRPALKSPLCFASASFGEIVAGGRKLAGSAQKRWPDGLLQQGSLPLKTEPEAMRKIFRTHVSPEEARTASLSDIRPGLERNALKEALKEAFEEVFGIVLLKDAPLKEEAALSDELLMTKYSTRGWNVSGARTGRKSEAKASP